MFFKNFTEVPSNYREFHQVNTIFDRIPLGDGMVTCLFDEFRQRLHILENDDVIGYFYRSFVFTEGITEACSDDRFGIVIRPSEPYNEEECRQYVVMKFYVEDRKK